MLTRFALTLAAVVTLTLAACAPGAPSASRNDPQSASVGLTLAGTYTGTAIVSFDDVGQLAYSGAYIVTVSGSIATLTGFCKASTSTSIAMTGATNAAYWQGSSACAVADFGFGNYTATVLTLTSGAIIALTDGSLVAQFNGSAVSTIAGGSSESPVTLLFVGAP